MVRILEDDTARVGDALLEPIADCRHVGHVASARDDERRDGKLTESRDRGLLGPAHFHVHGLDPSVRVRELADRPVRAERRPDVELEVGRALELTRGDGLLERRLPFGRHGGDVVPA